MEESAIRAISIGVGIFVIMVIISAILLYSNAAKSMATVTNQSVGTWDEVTNKDLFVYLNKVDVGTKVNCKGIDVINLIINHVNDDAYIALPSNSQVKLSSFKNAIGNVDESKILDINPNADVTVYINSKGVICVDGDIWYK